jgi:hypothetical protein
MGHGKEERGLQRLDTRHGAPAPTPARQLFSDPEATSGPHGVRHHSTIAGRYRAKIRVARRAIPKHRQNVIGESNTSFHERFHSDFQNQAKRSSPILER